MKYQMVLAFLALAIGAQCASVVYTADNSPANSVDLGQALEMYYQAFKKIMPCGYPPYNMPVLAPYTIDVMNFDYEFEFFKLKGNLSNTVVTGLNNYRVLASTYNSTTQHVTYDMVYDQIQVLGEYESDLDAKVMGFPFKTAGKGLINVKYIDFRIVGDFTFAPSIYNANGMRISDFHLNFYFGDITMNNWNKLWDISGNNFANKWCREFALMWAEQIQAQVDQLYSQLVLPNINGFLENISKKELIDILVMQAQTYNMADCNLA